MPDISDFIIRKGGIFFNIYKISTPAPVKLGSIYRISTKFSFMHYNMFIAVSRFITGSVGGRPAKTARPNVHARLASATERSRVPKPKRFVGA